jgi:hypothetical protein
MNAARLRLCWLLIIIGLLPFVILSFLNSMALDDYFYYELFTSKGFLGAQRFLYDHWSGRYTTTFLLGCFIRLDLPGRYPWLPTLLYFAATWGAICHVLSAGYLLVRHGHMMMSRTRVVSAAGAILFFLFLYVQADITTGFYWFCSMIVYQTAFILFLLLVASVVRRLNDPDVSFTGDILLYLLTLLLIGCNEMMAVFLPLFLFALILACRFFDRPSPRWLWICLGIAIVMDLLIFCTSGAITYRNKRMDTHTGYLTVLPIIGFQTVAVFYYIFKEPLFWLCAASLLVLGSRISQNRPLPQALAPFRRKNVFLPGLLTLGLLVGLSLGVFLMASHGSIPPRTLNNLSDIAACCLLALCFLAGVHRGARRPLTATLRPSGPIQLAILVAVTLASVNYLDAWKSAVSGYFYHAVIADRDRQLRTAQAAHRHSIELLPYNTVWRDKIRQTFPHGIFESVNILLLQKPPLLIYYDGASIGDPAYAHFYGLDSIILRQN